MKKEISITQIIALIIGCILLAGGSAFANVLHIGTIIGAIFIMVAGAITVKLFTARTPEVRK